MSNYPYKEHWILEIKDISREKIEKVQHFVPYADVYIKQLGLTEIEEFSQQFEPYGVTLVKILGESHIAFHSWPEYNYLHIDLLTCIELGLTKEKLQFLTEEVFEAEDVHIRQVN